MLVLLWLAGCAAIGIGGDHRLYGEGGRIALLDAGMTIFAVQGGTGKSDLISVFGGSGVETRQRPIIGIR